MTLLCRGISRLAFVAGPSWSSHQTLRRQSLGSVSRAFLSLPLGVLHVHTLPFLLAFDHVSSVDTCVALAHLLLVQLVRGMHHEPHRGGYDPRPRPPAPLSNPPFVPSPAEEVSLPPPRSRPRRCTDPPGPARRHRFEYSHGGCECIRKGWVGGSTQPSLTDVAIERGSAAASQTFTGVSCVAHERKHDGGASKDGSEAWKRRGRIDKEEWRRNGKEETWLTDGTCTGNDAWTTGTARGNRTMCVSETTMDIQQSVQCFGKKKTSVAVAHCKRGRGLLKLNGE